MDESSKKALISKLEDIIGNSCYNGKIQNWGPNFERYCDGREFRYPITFQQTGSGKDKRRHIDADMPMDQMRTGYYAFGANQLHIIEALEKIVDYLEVNHGLVAAKPK